MTKLEWYGNRVMWRATKLKLDACLWRNFSSGHDVAVEEILEAVHRFGTPLLIFWLNDMVWTLLTNQFLIGKAEGVVPSINLDELGIISTVNDNDWPPKELKRRAEYIAVGTEGARFWTPPGKKQFSLINILRMFPLNVPA